MLCFGLGCGGERKSVKNQLIDGPPRGVAMIHLMAPHAWDTNIKQLAELLLETRWKNIATSVLCGGGFGLDIPRLNHLVHVLSSEGRSLHLVIYVTNGASQRKWQTTPVDGLGTRVRPEDWRWRVQWDQATRQAYQQRVTDLDVVLQSLFELGGQAYLVPALEDNLTNDAFAALYDLTFPAVAPHLRSWIRVGRNPCLGCYPGNQGGLPEGAFLEEHVASAALFDHRDGVVSNDGREWLLPNESTNYPTSVSLADLRDVRNKAAVSNNLWILWKAAYQGLGDSLPLDPYLRNYRPPTLDEEIAIIDHIRD